jgi:hypothetical protein
LQRLTEAIPFFLAPHIITILRIEFVHALLDVPPEVLNWVEVGRVSWLVNRPNALQLEPRARCARGVYARVIVHKELRPTILRQESFLQSLDVTLATVATAGSIRIALYDHELTASRSTTFIQLYRPPYHLSWLATSR